MKNGAVAGSEFKEVKVDSVTVPGDKIELMWDDGRAIRLVWWGNFWKEVRPSRA